MKIVKAHNYYLQAGGEDTVFQSESRLLRSKGHQVVEYVESNERIAAANSAATALQTLWSWTSYSKFYHFIESVRPDIVHFHNTFPLISPSAYYACNRLDTPVVQTLDNQRLMCPSANFYRNGKLCVDCLGKSFAWPGVLHACYHKSGVHTTVVASMVAFHRLLGTWENRVDIYLCSTDFYKGLFVRSGLPGEKIMVIPHFTGAESRQETPKRKSDKYALFIGRMDPEKGINTLLSAWKNVNFPLKIRGSGHLEIWARTYVADNNMGGKVEFVGRLREIELDELFANSCFLVIPSEGYYETFGMVAVEAFSHGVPVLASNIGVLPELISDGKNGILFEAGNDKDLAAKADWLWSHPEEARRMGQNARAEYEMKYTPERNYQLLMDGYQRAISERSHGSRA